MIFRYWTKLIFYKQNILWMFLVSSIKPALLSFFLFKVFLFLPTIDISFILIRHCVIILLSSYGDFLKLLWIFFVEFLFVYWNFEILGFSMFTAVVYFLQIGSITLNLAYRAHSFVIMVIAVILALISFSSFSIFLPWFWVHFLMII